MGAAVATVIGQIITACLPYVSASHKDRQKRPAVISVSATDRRGHWFSASPAFCPRAACGGYGCQQQHDRKYGAMDEILEKAVRQIPMAVVGIVMKFFQIVIPSWSVWRRDVTIVGYNMAPDSATGEKLLQVLVRWHVWGCEALLIGRIHAAALSAFSAPQMRASITRTVR